MGRLAVWSLVRCWSSATERHFHRMATCSRGMREGLSTSLNSFSGPGLSMPANCWLYNALLRLWIAHLSRMFPIGLWSTISSCGIQWCLIMDEMHRLVFFLVFLLLLATSHASSQVDYPENCKIQCQRSFQTALAAEQLQWISRNVSADPFYVNPANLSAYAAGDVIRWEDVSPDIASVEWSLQHGTSLSRFLYMSEDLNGQPMPVSGFVLLPYANRAGDDRPVPTVAWAHGTAGGMRQCAPLNHRGLYYSWEGPLHAGTTGICSRGTGLCRTRQ